MPVRYYLTPYGLYHPKRPAAYCSKLWQYRQDGERVTTVKSYPHKAWCLNRFEASDTSHTAAQADVEIILIPFFNDAGEYLPLSAQVRDVAASHRADIAAFLENHRVPTGWITGTHTLGRVLRYIVQILLMAGWLKENYPEVGLTTQVRDLSTGQKQQVLRWMRRNGIETNDIDNNWTVRQVLGRIVSQYGWKASFAFGPEALL